MVVFLYVVLFLLLAFILIFILPIRVYFNAIGDSGDGFEAGGRIMIYAGLVGGGGKFMSPGRFFFEWYILSMRLFSIEVTRFVEKSRKTVKKKADKPEKKPKPEKAPSPKLPLKERISDIYNKARWGWGVFRETVRFDHCMGNITLGLANPARTGQLAGAIFALNGVLPSAFRINPSWDFSRKVFKGDISLKISILNYIIWKKIIAYAAGSISGKLRKPGMAGAITQEV